MGRWQTLVRLLGLLRRGGSPADIGLLKARLGKVRAPASVLERLEAADQTGLPPELDLDSLRDLPGETIGREYVRVLDDNGYQPFVLSKDLRPYASDQAFMMRYLFTHDFIHVATGFDTSWAGEIGVLAATVEQGFAPGGATQEWSARLIYWLRGFRHRKAIATNRRVGHRIGSKAQCLLTYPYEERLDRPVAEVRRELRLDSAALGGVVYPLPFGR